MGKASRRKKEKLGAAARGLEIPGFGFLPAGPVGEEMADRLERAEPCDFYSDGENAVALFDGFPPICDAIGMIGGSDFTKLQNPDFLSWVSENGADASLKEQSTATFLIASAYVDSVRELFVEGKVDSWGASIGEFVEKDPRFKPVLEFMPVFAVSLGFTLLIEHFAATLEDCLSMGFGDGNQTFLEICCDGPGGPETVLRTVGTLLRLGAKPTDRCLDDLKKKGSDYLEAIALLERAVLSTETQDVLPGTPKAEDEAEVPDKKGRTAKGSLRM